MATVQNTPISEIPGIYDRVQKTFREGKTQPLAYRRKQLLQLGHLVQDNVAAFHDAVLKDIGKPPFECATTELGVVIANVLNALKHLEEWTAPEQRVVEEWRSNWDTKIYPCPKGVALIIAPWNYPFVLVLNPLVGAIAAGCPAVLKPSEHTPRCAALLTELVPKYLDPEAYIVVNGDHAETTALLVHRWDHIFFTGSVAIGKVIAGVAAKHLSTVTLELGGKSPVVIAEDTDLDIAAKRTLYGKLQNTGQLCVSPDHVYVPRSIIAPFKEALKKAYNELWPEHPMSSEMKWGKIINQTHHSRLATILDRTLGDVLVGGEVEGSERIAPTVVSDVKLDDAMMEGEIFGPILPLVEVENVDEAIRVIANGPSPLALYLFTNSDTIRDRFIRETRSGALVHNDCCIQLLVYELPHGGVGESGNGKYFGKATFDEFTHRRSFLAVPPSLETTPILPGEISAIHARQV